MRIRQSLVNAVVGGKMRKWRNIALAGGRTAGSNTNAAHARKNFWHLLKRYPEVAASLGLTQDSVYTK